MFEVYSSVPNAHLLLSSLRSVGYTAETAIADIIDNSITAKATEINLIFDWNDYCIIIYDNGIGMNRDDLLSSMAIGSCDPEKERDISDLGRFGMGMKTAAFSLGRTLTVLTKCNNLISNARWDLDYIKSYNEWSLLIDSSEDEKICMLSEYMQNYSNGTLICISDIDKIIISDKNTNQEKNKFYKMIDSVKRHISMVFHRFLENNEIVIKVGTKEFLNDLLPWNPFCTYNRAVQELEQEELINNNHQIIIKPYILPHKTKFSNEDDFVKAGGHKGWLHHQGFYVYRNNRLIVYGTWFGIFKKEISYNLARISLDIYSDSDFDWQIDIKKSKAVPPVYAEQSIRRAAEMAVRQSVKVYNSRGTYERKVYSKAPQLSYVWEQRKNQYGIYSFYLNKKHTLLLKLKNSLNTEQKHLLDTYLELAEKCSPMSFSEITGTINNAKPEKLSENDIEILKCSAKELIKSLNINGYSKEEIKDLFCQLYEYFCIIDCFDEIYSEVV